MSSFEAGKKLPEAPDWETLNFQETVQYLEARGIKPLGNWTPGQPLLCLLPDRLRREYAQAWGIPMEKGPSIARFDAAAGVILGSREDGNDSSSGTIRNRMDKRVDYYAIDRETQTPTLVKSTLYDPSLFVNPDRAYKSYLIKAQFLYHARDELFPAGVNE